MHRHFDRSFGHPKGSSSFSRGRSCHRLENRELLEQFLLATLRVFVIQTLVRCLNELYSPRPVEHLSGVSRKERGN